MTVHIRQERRHEELGSLTAAEALTAFAALTTETAIGFCYRPETARWFRVDVGGTPTGPDGTRMELAGVFEVRAFTRTHELRWRAGERGTGPAVVVSDGTAASGQQPHLRDDAGYDRLLWGVTIGQATGGWLSLYEARIGTLDIPFDGPAPPDGRIWLRAVEYEAEDQYGNVAVVDERLTSIVSHPTTGGTR